MNLDYVVQMQMEVVGVPMSFLTLSVETPQEKRMIKSSGNFRKESGKENNQSYSSFKY